MKIIDEIKQITADQVAKKQDAAKINYPKIIDKIKAQAAIGQSTCKLSIHEMNEYDKKLLENDGFSVRLTEEMSNSKYDFIPQKIPIKIWQISW